MMSKEEQVQLRFKRRSILKEQSKKIKETLSLSKSRFANIAQQLSSNTENKSKTSPTGNNFGFNPRSNDQNRILLNEDNLLSDSDNAARKDVSFATTTATIILHRAWKLENSNISVKSNIFVKTW